MSAVPHGCSPKRVHRDNGADRDAVFQYMGGRPEATFQICGGGSSAGTDGTEGKIMADCIKCRPAEIPVRRCLSPALVAAVQEVEQDGGGNDRNADRADLESVTQFGKASLDTCTGISSARLGMNLGVGKCILTETLK